MANNPQPDLPITDVEQPALGPQPPVRAAGGLVWRDGEAGPQYAVVHRSRYDDWSLPKGKVHDGERHLAAGLREVAEEIGSTVVLSRRLTRIGYPILGVLKTVDYWAMRHVSGTFTPNDEVDEVRWLSAGEADALLSYRHDRRVLTAFSGPGVPTSTVVLVRHAKAGKSSRWKKDDRLRPLERAGRGQARGLAPFLAAFAPERILSARPLRCLDTVEPLAERLGLGVEPAAAFDDETNEQDPDAALGALRTLAAEHRCVVISSQGVTIPHIVDELGIAPSATRKAAAWVLSFRLERLVGADYYVHAPRELAEK